MRGKRPLTLLAAALAVASLAAPDAAADPVSTPPPASIVAVGAQALGPMFDRFAVDYNGRTPVPPLSVYSWDGVSPTPSPPPNPPVPIETKRDTQCVMTRPTNSDLAIAQLQKKTKTTDGQHYCVDLARSTHNITASNGPGLASVLFGNDLISYAYETGGNAPANLDDGELRAIYACNASLVPLADRTPGLTYGMTPVTWNMLRGALNRDPVIPVLPQSSTSDTGQDWYSSLVESSKLPPPCVVNGTSLTDGSPIAEDEGTNSMFSDPRYAKDIVFPFSAGAYVQEVITHVIFSRSPGKLVLGTIDGIPPITPANATPANQINVNGYRIPSVSGNHLYSAFPLAYIRGLYLVTLSSGASPWIPPYLLQLLGANNASGEICTITDATLAYAYVPAAKCGQVTHQ